MLSGRRLDLLDPSPLDVEIEDIAHGLARVARWNGQTKGAHIFSVAQHALLVEALARAKVPRLDATGRRAVLLHDAPEYVIGDMISPFKAVIGDSYKAVEHRLLAAIHLRFGLPAKLPESLAGADQGGRPQRGLSRSDAACRLRRRGGAPLFRPAAEILRRARARLSDALAGRDRRGALPRAAGKADARLTLSIASRKVIDMTQESLQRTAMIHVCSLARLYATVDETGARHIVTLLRLTDRVERPAHIAPENHLVLSVDDISAPMDGYTCPGDEHVARLIDFRRQLGPRGAHGGALLRRHQPLHRRRLRRRLRAQSQARRARDRPGTSAAPRAPRSRTRASSPSPTACSSATAAWCARSRPSAPAIGAMEGDPFRLELS